MWWLIINHPVDSQLIKSLYAWRTWIRSAYSASCRIRPWRIVPKKHSSLSGSKDWVGWSKLILLTASNFGLLTPKTSKFSESAEHRPKALQLLLMTISFELVATVPDQSGTNAVYNYLQEEYGSPDVHSLRKTLKNVWNDWRGDTSLPAELSCCFIWS